MSEMVPAALIFALLLGVEWRYQRSSVRVGAVLLALAVWLFFQPGYTTAARRVMAAAPEERVTQLRGSPLSEYQSGVETMRQAVDDQREAYADLRLLSLGVLVWLACSPVLRRARDPRIGNASESQLP